MNKNIPLVLLRVFLGIIFAFAVWPKISSGSAYVAQLTAFLQHFAMPNAHAFYRVFLERVVLPNINVFAALVRIAETFLAVALITGTATRLAGVVAMFLLTNYMFAKGMWWWLPASNDGADFMIALALVIGAAGRTFGFDSRLAARWPNVPLW